MARTLSAFAKRTLSGFCLALALGLAACAPSQSKPAVAQAPAATPAPTEAQAPVGLISGPGIEAADVAACSAKGGSLQRICRMGKVSCVISYPDANKACTDGSQCASNHCLAEYNATNDPKQAVRGVCKQDSDPCGCSTPLINGKPGSTLCVD